MVKTYKKQLEISELERGERVCNINVYVYLTDIFKICIYLKSKMKEITQRCNLNFVNKLQEQIDIAHHHK